MHIRDLQAELPWTVPYSAAYHAGQQNYSDMQHALIHIVKSAGILAGMIDKADHGESVPFDEQTIRNRVSDFVMCALRIANTCPTGAFDLEEAVIRRMEAVNGVTLETKPLSDRVTRRYMTETDKE
ncbi:MAG: hypothetical protein LCH63_10255 [Candidatus Melainabacteria bacterium]|nr:hypothetical protein [Candidatus Melainabacteria bacterium]